MTKSTKINTLSKTVDENKECEADLEQALDVVGFGVYNAKYCFVLTLFFVATIVEPLGNSYILPASKCDLQMSSTIRGFVASVPYIGMVLMAFPWGYLIDTQGRKTVVIASSLSGGLFGILSAFMPNLTSFIVCKCFGALCTASLVSAPYTYMGEMLPRKNKDVVLSVTNSVQLFGAALIPLFAWAILPSDFRIDFGMYEFRPWRLLCIVYALHYAVPALLLFSGPESPKYLLSQGRHDDAMAVLRAMYAGNKGKAPEDFPIKSLKMPDESKREKVSFLRSIREQSLPLLKPPYIQWILLNGFVLFGVFNALNGLSQWTPEVLNRVWSGFGNNEMTACEIIGQGRNKTLQVTTVCVDTIETRIYMINTSSVVTCSIVALLASGCVKLVGKKILLIVTLLANGLFCTAINWTTNPVVFATLLMARSIAAIGIGPVNAFSVEIFPTHLRGMAMGLTMMIGRAGSAMGANLVGVMIDSACVSMFYVFGGLLIMGSAVSCLLPRPKTTQPSKKNTEYISRL